MSQVNTVPVAAAPAPNPIPSHEIVAGVEWHRALVYWGEPGRQAKDGPSKEAQMLGVYARKGAGGGKGRLEGAERLKRIADVWHVTAVYALFDGPRLEYVGEGVLGNELDKYRRDSSKVWDGFC